MVFIILFGLLYLPVSILFPTKVINKKRMPIGRKCIATSNHYSNLDPLIYNFRFVKKFKFLAKKELFKTKLSAWFFRSIGAIRVDRNQVSPSVFKECLKQLKNDKQLFIFPEGTRNKQDTEEMGVIYSGVITFA
ncbi:MAG: 1-acyl-sn-glycerol-3-phosphate acyltransferase [Clostridia bacterium]|nr:1-acyl-sn-glycerol-3-phosphate acyltransferase [Clostridia bacterium]